MRSIIIGELPKGELPDAHRAQVQGKVNIKGKEVIPLDTAQVIEACAAIAPQVQAFAVSGMMSVRNASQELAVKNIIKKQCALPVVCGHELSSQLGFHDRTVTTVLNASLIDPVEAVKKATDGKGANLVIDFSGVPAAQKQCILMASKMGRVVFLGISHKGLDLSEKEVDTIMRSQLSVIGSWNSFTKPYPGEDWTESLKMFGERGMTARDIISHRLPLDDCPGIFDKIKEGGFFYNKVMFYPWGQE